MKVAVEVTSCQQCLYCFSARYGVTHMSFLCLKLHKGLRLRLVDEDDKGNIPENIHPECPFRDDLQETILAVTRDHFEKKGTLQTDQSE